MQILENVELAPLTTLGVGGQSRYFAVAGSERDLVAALRFGQHRRLDVRVLGGGSNLVISDQGFAGLVLQVNLRGSSVRPQDSEVLVEVRAGENWDRFVARTVNRNWQGLECLSGIPGRVGATPIQNVGAYGQEVSDTIESVRVVERATQRAYWVTAQDCGFSYRDSYFKSTAPERFVIVKVRFRLKPNGAPSLRYPELTRALEAEQCRTPTLSDVRRAVLALRRNKSMLTVPDDPNARSCGSFFLNPIVAEDSARAIEQRAGNGMPRYPQADGRVKLSAAWLIEQAGFHKGFGSKHVGLSTRHALSIVCHDQATAKDVVELAWELRAKVEGRFGVRLHPEPTFWGFSRLDEGLPRAQDLDRAK